MVIRGRISWLIGIEEAFDGEYSESTIHYKKCLEAEISSGVRCYLVTSLSKVMERVKWL